MLSAKFISERDRTMSVLNWPELQALAAKLNTQHDNNSVKAKWDDFQNSVRNIMDYRILHKMTSSRYILPWLNR